MTGSQQTSNPNQKLQSQTRFLLVRANNKRSLGAGGRGGGGGGRRGVGGSEGLKPTRHPHMLGV